VATGRPLENEALGSPQSRLQNRPKGKARGIEGQSPPLDGTRPKKCWPGGLSNCDYIVCRISSC